MQKFVKLTVTSHLINYMVIFKFIERGASDSRFQFNKSIQILELFSMY